MADENNHLHILHISTPLTWRGGEQQIAYLMAELRSKGVRQRILCPKGSEMAAFCQKNGFEYSLIAAAGSFSLGAAWTIHRVYRQNSISLIHAHDSHALNHSLLAHILLGLRLPIIVNRRVDFPINSRFKYNHQAVKRIICDSHKIRAVMAQCLGDDAKIVTIHSGIDVSRFQGRQSQGLLRREFALPSTVNLIGNVAAIADHKDYFTFLDTAKILLAKNDQLRFFIIGDGPDRDKIERYIVEKGLEKRIILTGFRSDIPDILSELDLFLITSKTEGLGTVILEAFAARVPVVATAAGGIPEIVSDGETGLLARVGDSQKLAENVQRILADDDLRTRLVNNAALVPPHFDKQEIAMKTMQVYREFL